MSHTAIMSDDQIKAALNSRPGERVTLEYMQSRITDKDFTVLPESTVTICNITLDNGYSVRGESACVDPANFDREIGQHYAEKQAMGKLWPLFGFLLAETRFLRADPAASVVEQAARELARVCHEANRAICEAFGDHSQKPWEQAEQWQKDSAIKGAIFAMQNSAAPPAAQHEAWMRDKAADGWVYGPVKDADAKTHPCMVPYDQLPPEQRAKDHVFKALVNTLTA